MASEPAIGLLRLASLWLSLADTKHTIMSTRAAAAASAPLAFGTSACNRTPGRRATRAMTSAASAICGTARGETNDVASKLGTPAAASASRISTFVAVGMGVGSAWKPSRVPTSVTSTLRSVGSRGEKLRAGAVMADAARGRPRGAIARDYHRCRRRVRWGFR